MIHFPPLVPDGAPLAVRSREDVLAQLPAWTKTSDTRPVTDALADALLAILLECQHQGSYAAAQADIGRAVGRYLDELGSERGHLRPPGEDQEAFRSRAIEIQHGASLGALRATVNTILAQYTTKTCEVIEPILDRWFVSTGAAAATARGFVGDGISPSCPARFYASDEERNGVSIPSAEPRGARAFERTAGVRTFMVIVPELGADPRVQTYAAPAEGSERSMFVSSAIPPGTPDEVVAQVLPMASFVRERAVTPLSIYRSIETAVNQLSGHSMRWILMTSKHL